MTAATEFPAASEKRADAIWSAIWNIVEENGLKAGDQLPSIRELAERLDVKQTIVRDALLRAETMGLIKVQPRAGVFLRARKPEIEREASVDSLETLFQSTLQQEEHNLFHLLDARRLIEIELAGRSAERRRLEDLLPVRRALEGMLQLGPDASRSEYVEYDVRFHIEIARLAGNAPLFAVQQTLMGLLTPHLNQVPHDWQRRSLTDRSHVAIYEALVAGDGRTVREELRTHLSLAYDCLLRDVQQPPALAQTVITSRPTTESPHHTDSPHEMES